MDARLRADDRLAAFLGYTDGTDSPTPTSRLIVGTVTPDTLDHIAAEHDLTLVATGKGGLADAFTTDNDRTPYTDPQRRLLTVTATGLPADHVFPGRRHVPGVNNALLSLHEEGEVFAGPYLHKDGIASWVLLAWARPGTATEDSFRQASDAASALKILQDLHRRVFPDVADDLDQLRVIDTDPHSWLTGAVTPRVR